MSVRLRSLAWPVARGLSRVAPLVIGFAILEAPLLLAERRLGVPVRVDVRPGAVLLFFYAALYGAYRVVWSHPVFRPGYRDWLESTPWTSARPLPLGPVDLSWGDGPVLGLCIGLAATLPEPRAVTLLCTFLLAHLLALAVSLWLTRCAAFGYATVLALGLAVRFWHQPSACLAALAAVYPIAYEGLRRALARSPRDWPRILTGRPEFVEWSRPASGWPHDRMIADVVGRSLRRIDMVLGCLLATWWLDAMVSLIGDPRDRSLFASYIFGWAIAIAPIARLLTYVNGYASPLGLWARFRLGRWVIPGYDQVFIGPLCAPLAGAATATLLRMCGVPLPSCLTTATGMIVLAALVTPPRLRRWRLTGRHRMSAPMGGGAANDKNQLMQVK